MLAGLLRTMRPHQWVKNGFVLAPLVFAQELDHVEATLRSGLALVFFCLVSSAVYVLNDLADVEVDRAHPLKRHRPIASGRVTVGAARATAIVLSVGSLGGAMLLDWRFAAVLTGYLALNLLYSFRLKRIAYVDVLCIATGFELRVVGGAFAAEVPPSTYLLVVTGLLALYLALGKRAHELAQGERSRSQRRSLGAYSQPLVDVLLWLTGVATVVTYVVYTLDPHTRATFGTNLLWVTTVMPAFGVFRFMRLVKSDLEKESPTEAMLKDWPFLLNLFVWVAAVLLLLYVGRSFS